MQNNGGSIINSSNNQILQDRRNGILTVVGGILIHLMIGNLYLWGNIEPYVISYFHRKGDTSLKHHNGILIIPLSMMFQAVFNVVGSYLQQRYNPKLIIFGGALIALTSIFIASRAQTCMMFVMFYGAGFPIGIGIM